MALNTTFQKAAKTVFKVFSSLIVPVDYVVIVKDGFDVDTRTVYGVDMIIDSFAERDVQFLSFSNLIQPTDVKGLVRGQQMRDLGLSELGTNDVVVRKDNSVEYSVIAYNTDPAEALYTLLLRKV
jgi:hypothetical protein